MKACRVDDSADMFQKAAVEGFYDTAMLSSVVADFVSERFGRRGLAFFGDRLACCFIGGVGEQ